MFVTIKAKVYTDAIGVYTELPANTSAPGQIADLRLYVQNVRSRRFTGS